jgi:hypothetical protein
MILRHNEEKLTTSVLQSSRLLVYWEFQWTAGRSINNNCIWQEVTPGLEYATLPTTVDPCPFILIIVG